MTVQGHLHQELQNLQSTKSEKIKNTKDGRHLKHFNELKLKKKPGQSLEDVLQADLNADSFPDSPSPNTKNNDVAYMVINRNDLATAYTNLTGRCPRKPSSGNKYILVAYHFDGNCIISWALKN